MYNMTGEIQDAVYMIQQGNYMATRLLAVDCIWNHAWERIRDQITTQIWNLIYDNALNVLNWRINNHEEY